MWLAYISQESYLPALKSGCWQIYNTTVILKVPSLFEVPKYLSQLHIKVKQSKRSTGHTDKNAADHKWMLLVIFIVMLQIVWKIEVIFNYS